MALGVVENVVCVAGDIDLCSNLTGLGVEHDKLRGKTAPDKEPMIRFIKSHGKISKCQIRLPCGDDFALLPIDYCHIAGIGNIYKNSLAVLLQLERFGMT